ncbi:MAG: TIGR02444 family protein [Phenylobacterium sp.]|nr:TIGR02444 family protein [Phenylobacterium sp.]
MDLWSWAVAAYGRPGVAEAALALQDDHGQCVPLMLWAAFARPLEPGVIAEAADLARAWEASAILPLRSARRGLKTDLPGVEAGAREALRVQVKTAELESERLLLAALSACGGPGGAGLDAALTAAVAAWGRPADVTALTKLSAALSGSLPDPGKPG